MGTRITIHSIRIKNFRSIKNEYLEAKNMNIFVENVDVRDTIVTMSPIDKKKEQIACWVAQSSEAEQKEYLKGLERTIRKLEEVFR